MNAATLQAGAVQAPRVPIVVAGGGPRTTLRFVAQYADACNFGAASWAGGSFTAEDHRQKLAILQRHCSELGRDDESVLRTGIAGLFFLAETEGAAQAKLAQVPPGLIAFAEQLTYVGTPEGAVARLRGLIDAGFQYLIAGVQVSDPESLQLLAKRIIPAVIDA